MLKPIAPDNWVDKRRQINPLDVVDQLELLVKLLQVRLFAVHMHDQDIEGCQQQHPLTFIIDIPSTQLF